MFNPKRYFLIFYLFIYFPNIFINYGHIIITFLGMMLFFSEVLFLSLKEVITNK